jgi:sialidase-1
MKSSLPSPRTDHRHRSFAAGLALLVALLGVTSQPGDAAEIPVTSAGHPEEGDLNLQLGDAAMTMQQVFRTERFPNIVVAIDGTVLASWGTSSVRVRRSEDGGATWGPEITIGKPGFQGGGLTVDETIGDVLAFVEDHHPPARLVIYRSKDQGRTWQAETPRIEGDSHGNIPSMHMNEHGITLRHGSHRGRLIRPTRWYAGKNDRAPWPQHYTNAIFSDDGGRSWQASEPFPAFGTGEATIAELSDGTVYYNTRRHWAPDGENPRRRWTAISKDGGATWADLTFCGILPDGPQDTNYGCMGGLTRLPVTGRDILLYSNCDSPQGRHHGTVWASFDGGRSWPLKRLVFEGAFAYSSMTSGRPGTSTAGWVYLNFEGGPDGGSTIARFNLNWLLDGERTGDGELPDGLPQSTAK